MEYVVCEQKVADSDAQQEEEVEPANGDVINLQEGSGEPFATTTLLKTCAKLKSLERGRDIHADVARRGLLEKNVFIGSSLVNLYAKCGMLAKAKEVFDKLIIRNVVSWNALIAGYAQQNQGCEALRFLDRMQCESVSPNAVTFACIVKACGSIGAVNKGQEIHAQVLQAVVWQEEAIMGNALIDMYAKCGRLTNAREIFDRLPVQSVIAWTALIAGYTQQGHGDKALDCYAQMRLKGLDPNAVTFLCTLKACGTSGAARHGQELHAQILKAGMLEKEDKIGSALVDMYAHCGLLGRAQDVFMDLTVQNVVSWTALMSGYSQHGHHKKALKCYEHMLLWGATPNLVTIVCVLKACTNLGIISKGQEIHNQIVRDGRWSKDIVVTNAVIEMYAKCGMLAKAQEVLDGLSTRNEISWNVLIAGYVQHDCSEDALKCYEQMQRDGLSPDEITFTSILKACGSLKAGEMGCEIHKRMHKGGLPGGNINAAIGLVDMYAKCGLLVKAQEVHDHLSIRNVGSWNALMLGYVQYGLGEKALDCFRKMLLEGHSPDGISLTCVLKACGSIGALEKGEEIHTQFVSDGLMEKDVAIANALIDMYVKCGALVRAQEVFDDLPARSVISYTVLITGFAQRGYGKEALNCFQCMQHEGVLPDSHTFACILKACGYVGATGLGQHIYALIVKDGLLKEDLIVSTALLDMYVKCGLVEKAQEVFDKLQVRNVSSWNAMIGGYSQHGKHENVFKLFNGMIEEGKKPDLVTFTTLLNTCGNRGLVGRAQAYFELMSANYGIIPMAEHYNCMVDLYCRVGDVDKLVAWMKRMPTMNDPVVWHTLMSACRMWGNTGLGKWAFENAVQLDENDAMAYVCMSNMYAEAETQCDAVKIDDLRSQCQSHTSPINQPVFDALHNSNVYLFSLLFGMSSCVL